MNGRVKNYSHKELWVVETDTGQPVAHRLGPNMQSPLGVDVAGFKTVDGTLIDGHGSWIKVVDFSTARVRYASGKMTAGCWLCWNVEEDEFGPVTYDYSSTWGEPL